MFYSALALSFVKFKERRYMKRNHNRPSINVEIGGIPFEFLCDTGANMSVMSKRVFKKIRGKGMIEKLILLNNMIIKAAGGKRLIPISAYRIPLDFRGRIIIQDFIVIDQLLSDAILGIDFIN